MKKYILAIYILLQFFSKALSQEISKAVWLHQDTADYQIQVFPNWRKNEFKQYVASYQKNTFKGDSLTKEVLVNKSIIEISVDDSTAVNYTLNYGIIQNLKENDASKNESINQIINDLGSQMDMDDFSLSYKTAKNGSFENYIDKEKTLDKCNLIIEAIKKDKDLERKKIPKKTQKLATTLMQTLMSGDNLFNQLFHINISNFHNVHGLTMGLNDTLGFIETIPAINGSKLSSDCILYINSLDSTTLETEFVIEKQFDEEKVTELISQMLKNNISDKKLSKEIAKASWNIFVKANYIIDINTGWPSFIKIIKETSGYSENAKPTVEQEVWLISNDLSEK
jgi:citrate lyase gamma subunit